MRVMTFRTFIGGLVLATVAAGAAWAGDYVVVSSTDEALKPGMELNGGTRVALAAGKTLTVMHMSGDVAVLRGAAAGVLIPTRTGASGDTARIGQLKALIAPGPTGRTFGGVRGGVCPEATSLTSINDILAAQAGGCVKEAKAALDAYVVKSGKGAKPVG